jgi:hypothetical protein
MYRIVFLCLLAAHAAGRTKEKEEEEERERERERERGYFVCTHADILPTLSALLLPWSRGDFGEGGGGGEGGRERWTKRDQYRRPMDQSRHQPPFLPPPPSLERTHVCERRTS